MHHSIRMGLIFTVLFFLNGCERGTRDGTAVLGQSTLDRVRQQGVISLGYANEAPYAYLDNATGEVVGEAPEIARALFEKMGGIKVEGVLTEFGALIPGLKAKRFDIIGAGMYITPERCREIAFSNPTYALGEAFIVQEGNPMELHSYEDVSRRSAARLGVVAGAVELQYARAASIPEDRIVVLPDTASAVAAVQAGRVDAFAGTSLTVQNLLNKAGVGPLERAKPFTDPIMDGKTVLGFGAFGFRKEDRPLREAFNRHLKEFIGSEEHLALIEPYGFTRLELPGEKTAEELCRP